MKKNYLFLFFLLLLSVSGIQAQTTPTKNYNRKVKAGNVYLVYDFGEISNGVPYKVYAVDVQRENKYYLSTLVNLQKGESMSVYIDDQFFGKMVALVDGWQYISITEYNINLSVGKHILRFEGRSSDLMIPMADEIALTIDRPVGRTTAPEEVNSFLNKVEQLKQQPAVVIPTVDEVGDLSSKVLPNPLGNYDHAIDTTFSYSHFSYIYLNVGAHTFTTSGSTINRSLTVFNPANYTYSWSNVNGGPGGESGLYLYVGLAGYYAVMLRPYTTGSGTTNIIYNGTTLVSNAVIGGRTYGMGSLKGGPMNFFTCKLSGGDTRMVASRYFASSVRGYNDDYSGGGGDWSWGLASRIKKDFSGSDSVQYAYVCSYSPTSTGISDVYLGNINSTVHSANYPEFPLLKADDAIMSGTNIGNYYNCISWSGGVTSTWIWPPSQYSTYNCPNNSTNITCFDNFYSNNPVRYPGAWNYTRTGATVNNSVVDVWALNGYYTHGSVRKPGNNHPHGYDWESKPGGTPRTLHPRNALTNLSYGYGAVVNYYIPTGTYARNGAAGLSFETDADAVKAGVAVFEKAKLTETADQKLNTLLRKTNASFISEFTDLYEAWKKTWATNIIYSDPAAYCKNAEFAAMAELARTNPRQAMLLVFDKFVNHNDHLIGELMWTLTKDKYAYLLTEVKTERAARPNDAAGRYRIHGDHDNGVLYVEKILKLLEEEVIVPVTDAVQVTVSPNPVKDRLTVQLTADKSVRVSVTAISAQTRQSNVLQPETVLTKGVHRFSMDISRFAGTTGDIIAVQVMIDGQLRTIKVLVAK
jgi:hypothetical protein